MVESPSLSEHLKAQLDSLPQKPGCYLFKDTHGEVLYVGKAVNLRQRVRSYFQSGAQHNRRTMLLVNKVAHVEWIVVGSELEALILEMNLIKKHRPHFNIRLKDDKRYPYIKVHWADAYPKVTVTRRMVGDGARYFGPYTSVWAVHQTLDILRRIFPYLTCDREITGQDQRACLYYDIKLCTAPCIGAIDQKSYRLMIDDLCKFLEGRTEPIVSRLRLEMEHAAEILQFERAAMLRDQLQAIENVVKRQRVVSTEYIDSDVLALARSEDEACVQVFFIRGGKLIGQDYFLLEGISDTSDAKVMAEFLKQFYDQTPTVPPQVLLPYEVEEAQIIQQWLRQRREDQKAEILVPRRGKQRELIQLVAENAMETLRALKAQWEVDKHRQEQALIELQNNLNLAMPLNRVECYDISNTQGTAAVGSMVVFEQGVARKNLYRRFNIRSVQGPDDFASMEEVLTRRFNRWLTAQQVQQQPGKKLDMAFGRLPDLLIVDGGKGQLNRALAVLQRFNLQDKIPVVGLAKQHEELYLPGRADPIILPRNSQGLYLLQRIRDEAHRFAISGHRQKRTKRGLASQLDSIPGIGPSRRRALLQRFKSLEGIRNATISELAAVPGISLALAQTIKDHLA